MTTYTKKVTIKWSSEEDRAGDPNNAFTVARFDKGEEMTANGKTDGKVLLGKLTSTRRFIDQNAAEEYLNFILAAAANNNVTIVEYSITDC